jgi:hypothetical protein
MVASIPNVLSRRHCAVSLRDNVWPWVMDRHPVTWCKNNHNNTELCSDGYTKINAYRMLAGKHRGKWRCCSSGLWRCVLVGIPEDGGNMFLRNVGIYLRVYTASQSIRTTSSFSPPWEGQTLGKWPLEGEEEDVRIIWWILGKYVVRMVGARRLWTVLSSGRRN